MRLCLGGGGGGVGGLWLLTHRATLLISVSSHKE